MSDLIKWPFVSEETFMLGFDMVENYEDWSSSSHTFDGKSVKIWTANGLFFIDFNPRIGAFNIIEKIWIKMCIKKSTFRKVLSLCGEE